jgi:hypothetical protein
MTMTAGTSSTIQQAQARGWLGWSSLVRLSLTEPR